MTGAAKSLVKRSEYHPLSEVKGEAVVERKIQVNLTKVAVTVFKGIWRVASGLGHVLFVPSPAQEHIDEMRVKYHRMGPHF